MEEGTGIVHIAPGCGAEDFELGKREGLATIVPVDESGAFYAASAGCTGGTPPTPPSRSSRTWASAGGWWRRARSPTATPSAGAAAPS